MDVASLEPSKELYELSGWRNTVYWWRLHKPSGRNKLYTFHEMDHDRSRFRNSPETPRFNEENDFFPAYDLGYLLRKLPDHIPYNGGELPVRIEPWIAGGWWAHYGRYDLRSAIADTPEDALCKLSIELFKQGILPKSPKESE